jgi:hypothetical protein
MTGERTISVICASAPAAVMARADEPARRLADHVILEKIASRANEEREAPERFDLVVRIARRNRHVYALACCELTDEIGEFLRAVVRAFPMLAKRSRDSIRQTPQFPVVEILNTKHR